MEWLIAIALGAATAAGPAAQGADGERAVVAETDRMNARQFDERTRMSRTHPNELWRLYGSDAAARGDWGDAMRHFRHAARYGDKYSQHRISLMYWHGVGVERDPRPGLRLGRPRRRTHVPELRGPAREDVEADGAGRA